MSAIRSASPGVATGLFAARLRESGKALQLIEYAGVIMVGTTGFEPVTSCV
jgi:hypothetical protein